ARPTDAALTGQIRSASGAVADRESGVRAELRPAGATRRAGVARVWSRAGDAVRAGVAHALGAHLAGTAGNAVAEARAAVRAGGDTVLAGDCAAVASVQRPAGEAGGAHGRASARLAELVGPAADAVEGIAD